MPKVSVIIPAYNAAAHLQDAVHSVLLIANGRTGLLFGPGDPTDLVRQALTLDGIARDLRPSARAEYERRFAPDVNYRVLRDVYLAAARSHGTDRVAASS
jgi:hypothetical protein